MWPENPNAEVSQVEAVRSDAKVVDTDSKDDRNKCPMPPTPPCADVYGDTQCDCVNNTEEIMGIVNEVVAKIPVVLSEFTVQINTTAMIRLPEPALEIKNIKKRVKVTQCLLIQDTNMLFIKGFVRKNIDYSTRSCSNNEAVCGDLRHCTVDVPFSCTTPVTYNGTDPAQLIRNSVEEFEFFKTDDLDSPQFAEKDELLSGDFSEYNQISSEYFNERPYCELIKSRIVEYDEFLDRRRPIYTDLPFEEKEFTKIEEKMVIYLTLKLLQKRQVRLNDPCCR